MIPRALRERLTAFQGTPLGERLLPNFYTHYFFTPKGLFLPAQNVVYIPIQKVANTSIRKALRVHVGEDRFMSLGRRGESYDVLTLPEIARLTSAFRFAFVRNPLDRLASCYQDKITSARKGRSSIFGVYSRGTYPFLPHAEFVPGMPFSEFVELVCRIPDKFADRHFRSQHLFVYHKGRQAVDFVGRFECLAEDWLQICNRVPLGPLSEQNASAGEDFRSMYTPATARLAARRYATDVRLFGYEDSLRELIHG